MKFIFHGSFYEVGRSCIELKTKKSRILLDLGTKITPKGVEYPTLPHGHGIDLVAVSHAHLDHSGAMPFYRHNGLNCPILCTKMTKVLAKILLRDSYKVERIENLHTLYDEEDVFAVLDRMKLIEFNGHEEFQDMDFTFFDAGHIPGSSSILVETEGKRILYTGDITTQDSNLMRGADTDYGHVDILICESTYGDRDHTNRTQEETRFLRHIKETLANDGSMLIPTLAVGRAQEMLLMLGKEKYGVPIYFDGMAKKVLGKLLENPNLLRDPEALRRITKRIKLVHGRKYREEIIKTRGIFVSPSGMLDGGPIVEYLKGFWHQENAALALTSYQAVDTNGRLLLDTGDVYIDGTKRHVHCCVEKYDFSSHIGMTPVHNYIKKVNPKLIIFNHGEAAGIDALAKWAKSEGYEVHAPHNGDVLVL